MSDDRGGSAFLAFLLGGLTGAALALLYAPRSGRETREMLNEKMREGAERGKDLREQAREKGRAFMDEAGGYVDTLGAMVGGVVALHAPRTIPQSWLAAREPLALGVGRA